MPTIVAEGGLPTQVGHGAEPSYAFMAGVNRPSLGRPEPSTLVEFERRLLVLLGFGAREHRCTSHLSELVGGVARERERSTVT